MKKIFIIFTLCLILCFTLYSESFAADPKLIKTIKNAFEKIKDYILTIATPAAAVAVGTGVLMKKFSFGDDEKIRAGKKLIRTALFSYVFIILLNLILTTISNLLSS